MRNQIMRCASLLAVVAVAMAGCVPVVWQRVEANNRIEQNRAFTVELPEGWMRYAPVNGSLNVSTNKGEHVVKVTRVMITRDGPNLQRINVMRLDSKDAFPRIERGYSDGMLPSEAAELYIADIKATSTLENLTVLKNAPYSIAGKQGFEVHVKYKTEKGLAYERLTYGFGDAGGFYLLSLDAPSVYFFPLHREAFNRMVTSFRLGTTKA